MDGDFHKSYLRMYKGTYIRSTVKKAFPFFNGFYTAMFGNSEADEAPPDSTVRYCTTRYHNEIAHGENTVIENNIDNADEEK